MDCLGKFVFDYGFRIERVRIVLFERDHRGQLIVFRSQSIVLRCRNIKRKIRLISYRITVYGNKCYAVVISSNCIFTEAGINIYKFFCISLFLEQAK